MPETQLLRIPAVEFAQRTDPGRDPDKQVNEDAADHRETRFGHLCVLCDGMGGHLGGREASNLAIRTIFDAFEHAPVRPDLPPGVRGRELLTEAIVAANGRVYGLGGTGALAARPGSTVVAILVHEDGTEIVHVGDSRCYLIHAGQVLQLTKDHSAVQKLVDAQMLTPAQAAVHPDANKITRALGMSADVEVELRPQPWPHVAGDVFVLCSDGLSDLVEPADILRIAGTAPAPQAAGQLVDLANARGGHDNITVQVVRLRESVAGPRQDAVGPTVTQTMPQPPGGMPASGPRGQGATSVPAFDRGVPTVPPTRTGERRRVPTSALVAGLIGAIGIAVVGFALYDEIVVHHAQHHVVPFALSALPSASAPPSASLAPLTPEPVPSATSVDAAPAPLPSLVPARPPRGQGRGAPVPIPTPPPPIPTPF